MEPLRDYAADRRRRYGPPGDAEAFLLHRPQRSHQLHRGQPHVHHAASAAGLDLGRPRPRATRARHAPPDGGAAYPGWHAQGVDVDRKIAVLATYLGHVEVREVYWYLAAVPELMSIIADRFEAFADRLPAGVS